MGDRSSALRRDSIGLVPSDARPLLLVLALLFVSFVAIAAMTKVLGIDVADDVEAAIVANCAPDGVPRCLFRSSDEPDPIEISVRSMASAIEEYGSEAELVRNEVIDPPTGRCLVVEGGRDVCIEHEDDRLLDGLKEVARLP